MEDSELEEGEAFQYKDDDDNNIDPEIALSYIVRVHLNVVVSIIFSGFSMVIVLNFLT